MRVWTKAFERVVYVFPEYTVKNANSERTLPELAFFDLCHVFLNVFNAAETCM